MLLVILRLFGKISKAHYLYINLKMKAKIMIGLNFLTLFKLSFILYFTASGKLYLAGSTNYYFLDY